ncbi:MAG: (2Fe-2S)-binding protein [Planctomycetaceae bacterium]|jgi:phenylpropionate dioxygenase-like ring-hydroxylating dioxygenase large terminal subunit|nr:(2Fe-2S)-binding protein [Planctomycetaceae bacterium]MDP6063106.1 aromatic ring-hydroxylating dioxygenase subunit alpha [Acidimicrobiales bacterium]|tara:strand:+ start:6984 stop:8150 length:1167 start_codon:yes stop_codon:yes gene_type:complete
MNLFTPELLDSFDSSIVPQSEADTLPPVIYTSEEFLEFERRAIFDHEWVCVGLASRVPDPGDWFTVDVNGERLIITRDKEGVVRALSSVCQHRAQAICEGSGSSTTFKCPYHHWIYGLDGRLLGAPAMEKTENFDKKDWGLPNIQVEVWQGFVFVNFDADAEPLAPTLERYNPYLEHYDLTNCRCTDTVVLEDMPWNWKIMFENFNDGYHATKLHEYIQDFCPSELSTFPVPWDDDSNVIFREAGYLHIDAGFNATHKALYPVFPDLTEEERWRSTFALIPPSLCLGTAPDQAFYFIVRPKTASTIDVEIGTLLHPDTFEHPMFEQLLETAIAGIQVFVDQDQDVTKKVQVGLNSRFAPRGRYSWQEESHVQFNRWLVKRYRERWPRD